MSKDFSISVTFSIPLSLKEQIDTFTNEQRYDSKSSLVCEAIREKLAKLEAKG